MQTSLIAIGGVIVVGVVSYNKWQEWRAKKSVEKAFSPLEEDVLMGARPLGERHEPVLSPMHDDAATESDHRSFTHDVSGTHHAFIESAAKPFPLDTFIDCIIPISLEFPLRGEKITNAFHQLRLVGNKHVEVIGETDTGEWEKVAVDAAG